MSNARRVTRWEGLGIILVAVLLAVGIGMADSGVEPWMAVVAGVAIGGAIVWDLRRRP